MNLRLAEQSWTGHYVLDFRKLLAESTDPSVPGPDDDPNQPVFSMLMGNSSHVQ
ncbi:hypothetical protein DFH07DRAFT_952138 [Mycena maculata]|uniref:Uncharacterized protein n=1 Tax=Mycena maculata TaxID=230809 RepID=A0AAD7K4W3_9AGAR|nr:hypothetical protein DFH07DRAFT_952138 [Mycena maculata]